MVVITIQREAPISQDILCLITDHGYMPLPRPVIPQDTYVDTMGAGFAHQPQYRGDAKGLFLVINPHGEF
jgi:hypothetical protein